MYRDIQNTYSLGIPASYFWLVYRCPCILIWFEVECRRPFTSTRWIGGTNKQKFFSYSRNTLFLFVRILSHPVDVNNLQFCQQQKRLLPFAKKNTKQLDQHATTIKNILRIVEASSPIRKNIDSKFRARERHKKCFANGRSVFPHSWKQQQEDWRASMSKQCFTNSRSAFSHSWKY